MGAAAIPPEHRVQCSPPSGQGRSDEELRFEIDGAPAGVKLRISRLTRQLVAELPKRAHDLLEIAALVYGVDATIRRGGSADQQMGAKWHRRFVVEMPVRDQTFWVRDDVRAALEEMLMFLSGDRFVFAFSQKDDLGADQTRFFKFDPDSAWQATRVLMFSGGLDSFAGALEEVAEHGQRVALVSHFSASKIAPVQRKLQSTLLDRFGPDSCRHVPVQVQMTAGSMKEGTHRSRSFLFAVLGAITAQAFRLDRVSFHENGVVSLNLPPVGNVLGTRATRTTHPQTLTRFTRLLRRVFDAGMNVDNPFFWRTKKDVVETVARLGMADEIADTRSCADVHNQTKQHPHCGRCSQCIDRRFALLSAGMERFDPGEAYRMSLMDDPRHGAIDREIALSYLRNALAFEHMRPTDLECAFPAVLDAVNHLDKPATTAIEMIASLLNRHGAGVARVMRQTLSNNVGESFPQGSLPRLFGDVQRPVILPTVQTPATLPMAGEQETLVMQIGKSDGAVSFDPAVALRSRATAALLTVLAEEWLAGAGEGLPPLDYPLIRAQDLAQRLGLGGEEAVRRRVNRARKQLEAAFDSAGLDPDLGGRLIENLPWHGYRLTPDMVTVRRHRPGK